jgi:hypothetical protein
MVATERGVVALKRRTSVDNNSSGIVPEPHLRAFYRRLLAAAKPKRSQNRASSRSTQSRQNRAQGMALRRALLMGFSQPAQTP